MRAPNSPLAARLTTRRLAASLAAMIVALAGLTMASLPAQAASFQVYDADDFVDAVTAASSTSGSHTISVMSSFEYESTDPVTFSGDGDLTIEGNGNTVTLDEAEGLFIGDTLEAVTITFRDITITGNAEGAAILIYGSSTSVLDNVTVTDYLALSSAVILASDGIEVLNSTFTNNTSALSSGGALSLEGETIVVSDSTFTGNKALDANGGAIAIDGNEDSESADIVNSVFGGNEAEFDGGAISTSASVNVTGSVFDNNTSHNSGGAIAGGGFFVIEESVFTNNDSGEEGGAIASFGFASVLTSTFDNNTAADQGGAIYSQYGVEIFYSTLSNNSTGFEGGAVYSDYETAYVGASTFTGNSAEQGGAVFQSGSDAYIVFSTFTGNSSNDADGAHVYSMQNLYTVASVYSDATGGDACSTDSTFSSGSNVDVDGTCTDDWEGPQDVTDSNGQFEALADNGGPTLTSMPSVTSRAINNVQEEACADFESLAPIYANGFDGFGIDELDELFDEYGEAAVAAYDQRGASRSEIVDAQGGSCDAGAVEYVAPATFTVAGPSGNVSGVVSNALEVACLSNVSAASAGGTPPAGIAFPHGATGFCANTLFEGDSVDVTLTLPSPANQLWKTATGAWVQVPGAVFSPNKLTVTYSVTDGGSLDADGAANRTIVDPVAPGIGAVFTG